MTTGELIPDDFKIFRLNLSEAEVAAKWFVELNVSEDAITVLKKSTSTYEDALVAKEYILRNSPPIELPRNGDRYVNEPLTEKELERVRCSIGRQSPYGDSRWQVEISKRLGLESTLRPRGRPRKGEEGRLKK